jgi:hypothetical protein
VARVLVVPGVLVVPSMPVAPSILIMPAACATLLVLMTGVRIRSVVPFVPGVARVFVSIAHQSLRSGTLWPSCSRR